MDRRTNASRITLFILVLSPVWLCAGCGDGRPARVPVSGQVLIDGDPIPCGFIRLMPEGALASSGKIGSDGRFTLSCFGEGDGAVLGTHVVTVTAFKELGPKRQRWHAPKKYVNPSTSDLKATIDGPTDDLQINLTWNGGKPFVERLDTGE